MRLFYSNKKLNLALCGLLAASVSISGCVTSRPDNLQAAKLAEGKGDLQLAQQSYQRAASDTSLPREERVTALVNLGGLYHQQGKLASAESTYRKALALAPSNSLALNNLAKIFFDSGRFAEAARHFTRAAAAKPHDSTIQTYLGLSHLRAGDKDKARSAFKSALRIDPQNEDAAVNLAALSPQHAGEELKRFLERNPKASKGWAMLSAWHASRSDFKSALAAIDRAIALDRNSANFQNTKGNLFLKQGRLDEALSAWRTALRMKPASARSSGRAAGERWMLRNNPKSGGTPARFLAIIGPDPAQSQSAPEPIENPASYQEVVDKYQRLIKAGQKRADVYINLGHAYASIGRLEDAMAAWQVALTLPSKQRGYAQHNLGVAYERKGNLQEALHAYQSAVNSMPKFAEGYRNLARVQVKLGDKLAALASFRQALQLNPTSSEILHEIGLYYQNENRLDEALQSYSSALKQNPRSSASLYNLGLVTIKQGKFKLAEEYFSQALQTNARDSEAAVNLGFSLAKQNKIEQAAAAWKQALEFQTESSEALNNLGIVSLRAGKFDEAEQYFKRASPGRDGGAGAYANLAAVYLKQGKVEQAEELYKQSLQKDPNGFEPLLNLGIFSLIKGEPARAEPLLGQALAASPNSPEALFHLALAQHMLSKRKAAAESYRRFLDLAKGSPSFEDEVSQAEEALSSLAIGD